MFAPGMPLPHNRIYWATDMVFSATFVWLILLAATGIVNIVSYPGIFRAFDPSRAILRE